MPTPVDRFEITRHLYEEYEATASAYCSGIIERDRLREQNTNLRKALKELIQVCPRRAWCHAALDEARALLRQIEEG